MNRYSITLIVFSIMVVSLPGRVYADLYGRQEPSDGFVWYRICDDDGQEGATDRDGNILIPTKYDEVIYYTTNGGWFSVEKDDKYGVYSTSGIMICDAIYDDVRYREDHGAIWIEFKQDGGTGIMDRNGNIAVPPDAMYNDNPIYATHGGTLYTSCNGKRIHIDYRFTNSIPSGRTVMSPGFHIELSNGTVVEGSRSSDGKRGINDAEGRILVPAKYYSADYICRADGKEWFEVRNHRETETGYGYRYGFYKTSGEIICDAIYDAAKYCISDDDIWISVSLDGACGALDENGNVIVPLTQKNWLYYDKIVGFYYKNSVGGRVPIGVYLPGRKTDE